MVVLGWCVPAAHEWHRLEGFCHELYFVPTCRGLSITRSSSLGFS